MSIAMALSILLLQNKTQSLSGNLVRGGRDNSGHVGAASPAVLTVPAAPAHRCLFSSRV